MRLSDVRPRSTIDNVPNRDPADTELTPEIAKAIAIRIPSTDGFDAGFSQTRCAITFTAWYQLWMSLRHMRRAACVALFLVSIIHVV